MLLGTPLQVSLALNDDVSRRGNSAVNRDFDFLALLCLQRSREFVGIHIPEGAVADMEDPDPTPVFVHFIEYSVYAVALTEQQTPNLSPRLPGLPGQWAPRWHTLQGTQSVHELVEPFRPARGSFGGYPLVESVRIVLRWISENDLASHDLPGILFRISSMASHARLQRQRDRV